jgi:hypothetical protein
MKPNRFLPIVLVFMLLGVGQLAGQVPAPAQVAAPTYTSTSQPTERPTAVPTPTPTIQEPAPAEPGYLWYWGTDSGWSINKHPGYDALYLPRQDFYIAKAGCGGGHGEVCSNFERGQSWGTSVNLSPTKTPPSARYVYWYLFGPDSGYMKDPFSGTSYPDLYGIAQAQNFYATYKLFYAYDFQGNTLFVDIETRDGLWRRGDPRDTSNISARIWRDNRLVLNSFLGELRYLLRGEKQIGVYTSKHELASLFGPDYEFPFPVVVWLPNYPTETVVCTIYSDEYRSVVDINPLNNNIIPGSGYPGIPYPKYEMIQQYGIDTSIFETDVGGYWPVIWQFCNDWGDLAVQSPASGFTPIPGE